MFDGIFRGGGYLEIFGVEEAGFRWALIDRDMMLNQALLEGSDVRSMVSQQQVLDHVFSPLFLANRVTADRLLPIVIENIRCLLCSSHVCPALTRPPGTDLLPSTTTAWTWRCTSSWCAFVWSARPRATPPCTISFSITLSRRQGSSRACCCKVKLPFAPPVYVVFSRFACSHWRFAVDQSYPGATQLALDMLLKVDCSIHTTHSCHYEKL